MKVLISFFMVSSIISANDCSARNPLLTENNTLHKAVPFDKVSPADIEEAIMAGIKNHESEIDAIVNNPDSPTFANTLSAFDRSGTLLNESVLLLSNLESATGDTLIMNLMEKVTPLISQHSTNVILNEGLWKRIKAVKEDKEACNGLSSEQKRLLDETFRVFAENGANLEGEKRDRYRELNERLSNLTVKFGQNVTNEMKSPEKRLWLKEEDLKGLPQDIITAARSEANAVLTAERKEDDGTLYLFTVFAPSYIPFMKYADSRELRKKMYQLSASRNNGGEFDNTKILKDIANTRLEIAKLMGKDNFAQYQLQGTMAGTPENVMKLLKQLDENYSDPMSREIAEIEEYARHSQGEEFVLMPWDYSYWSNKLKNEKYSFNDREMKPYFELNNTINGVFSLATDLYGYTFKENKELPVYHPDVKAFEVYDADGSILGILYTDFYFREGKRPGAWMTEFRTETKDDNGNRQIPLISIVTNFSKPIGDEAVLLTPSEVQTFLHEFGHALHGLSSQATYVSLSGTNVYHDFVELFSQFNENFLTEKEFLDKFARHYISGEKMPEEMVARFISSNRFGAAYACMRQLGFGFLDMAYHTITEPLGETVDVAVFEEEAIKPVKVFDMVDGCLISPAFGHIFSGGYAAGYYGYKWAEVLDADAFEAFKENGIYDKGTALKFKKMLQSGGTVDPMALYLEFRGKEPTVDALMKRDGIK